MKKSICVLLCCLLLAACATTPGDVSSVAASSKAGAASSAAQASSEILSADASSKVAASSTAQASSEILSADASSTASIPYSPPADTRVINGKTYQLTFVDEFEGDALDTTKWALCPEWNRGDKIIKARWADKMVSVKDGNLVITAEAGDDGIYVCGGVRTLSKDYRNELWSQCKGYFECRCRLPVATGCIGAFWLMSRSMNDASVGKGASNGAEIDILESFNTSKGGINHAIHWDGYGANTQSKGKQVFNRACYSGFHTYGLAWTDDEYIFYIDGKESWRIGNSTVANIVCEVPLYLKLTVEFGEWAGFPTANDFPVQFLVDYVRVYQAV